MKAHHWIVIVLALIGGWWAGKKGIGPKMGG